MIPTFRRVWAPRGKRPTASSRRRYQWGYLYSFVHPKSGETVNFIGTTVNTEAMNGVLRAFAETVGAGEKKRAIVVLDGAGWHTSASLVVPDGVHLVLLPPYSPELQPAERIWPLVNEGLANREHRDLATLTSLVGDRCAFLDGNRDLVGRLTRYHWWPEDVPANE